MAKKEKRVKKEKIKKDSIFKRIARRYNFKLLKESISSYGFEYSFKKFATTFLIVVAILAGLAFYMKIHVFGICLILLEVVLALPYIINAQFAQLYQIKRFSMVRDYLDNILPIFKNFPKIAVAWESVLDMLEGEMKEAVEEALNYLTTNSSDVNAEETAFAIIESRFPNSRIHSVHQMMYTVEKENSVDYMASVDNMYYDVQSWITRVFGFQKDIAKSRTNLIMLCVLSIFCSCFMTQMFGDAGIFKGYTDNIAYQISSVVFIMVIVLCICLSYIKLTGNWLVDDKTISKSDAYYKSFEYLKTHTKEKVKEENKKFRIVSIMIAAVGVFFYIKDTSNMTLLLLCMFMAFLLSTQKTRTYKMHYKKIRFFLELEYPIWMRDVALNLHNYTVVNAIEESKSNRSEIMQYYIDRFLQEVYEQPSSIKPYNNFLREFDIDGVMSSVKVLYSLKNLNKEQSQEQINSLIVRNQTMLERSEALRNEDIISAVRLLGFAPTVLFMLNVVISMGILFVFMITNLSGAI